MKPQLHVTALNMLSKCGEQFRRRYIEGEKRPPGVALVVGTGVHKSVAANLSHAIETGRLRSIGECADIARDAVASQWDAGVALNDDDLADGPVAAKGAAVDKAVRLARLHAAELAPRLVPTHVERGFCLELEGYPVDLAGTLDIQEHGAVRDTKTASRTPPADAADKSDQLTMYAMAVTALDGVTPAAVTLDTLVDLKTGPKISVSESRRTPADFAPLMRRVEAAVVAIEKAVFVPAKQDDWWCSPKWCGYYETCRYVRRPTVGVVPLTLKGVQQNVQSTESE